MRPRDTIEQDAATLALQALAWTLAEPTRAARLLALTGLDPRDLRARAGEPSTLAAALGFVEAHEPDLVACADALGVAPAALVSARRSLEAA
jgi:adenine/guanine phosphoribosyltransferase-like PRPP-binding protein